MQRDRKQRWCCIHTFRTEQAAGHGAFYFCECFPQTNITCNIGGGDVAYKRKGTTPSRSHLCVYLLLLLLVKISIYIKV